MTLSAKPTSVNREGIKNSGIHACFCYKILIDDYDALDAADSFCIAKPGFGKTVLSTSIIQDLGSCLSTNSKAGNLRPVVAFFYFDRSSRTGGKTSGEAFRALAAQLIAAHRNEGSVMDALLILFDKDSGC